MSKSRTIPHFPSTVDLFRYLSACFAAQLGRHTVALYDVARKHGATHKEIGASINMKPDALTHYIKKHRKGETNDE